MLLENSVTKFSHWNRFFAVNLNIVVSSGSSISLSNSSLGPHVRFDWAFCTLRKFSHFSFLFCLNGRLGFYFLNASSFSTLIVSCILYARVGDVLHSKRNRTRWHPHTREQRSAFCEIRSGIQTTTSHNERLIVSHNFEYSKQKKKRNNYCINF